MTMKPLTLARIAVVAAAPLLLAASGTMPSYAAPVTAQAQGQSQSASQSASSPQARPQTQPQLLSHCTGSGCAGKSPVSTGCDHHARTVRRSSEIGPLIELRYSSTCRAAWVRVTHARGGDRIEARNKGGACRAKSCYSKTVPRGQTSAYTAMVNDKGIKAWGCLYRRNGNIVCTDAY